MQNLKKHVFGPFSFIHLSSLGKYITGIPPLGIDTSLVGIEYCTSSARGTYLTGTEELSSTTSQEICCSCFTGLSHWFFTSMTNTSFSNVHER